MNLTANSQPTSLKSNSAVIIALITVFLITKHSLVALNVPPLRSDPCDAVGAFALITIIFIVITSLVRAFDRHPKSLSSALLPLYLLRSQQAVVLAVFITIAADVVALGRHTAMWVNLVSPTYLLVLLGNLAVIGVTAQFLIFVVQRTPSQTQSIRWSLVVFTALFAIAVLVFCPEWPHDHDSTTAHILTVAIGALMVFVPMRLLLPELVPYGSNAHRKRSVSGAVREWLSPVAGVLMGAFGFWVNSISVDGALRHAHPSAFVLSIAGLLVANAFLGESLGLGGEKRWGEKGSTPGCTTSCHRISPGRSA
jgi:hypothetical protein